MSRHLVLVLGDQLDADAAAFEGFYPAQDAGPGDDCPWRVPW